MQLPRTTADKYIVEAVARALDVLEAFRNGEELTLVEISQRVGLNKSRAFRLLYTLAERDYVERTADGSRYVLGLKLFERAAHVRRGLKRIAQPIMQRLHEQFNETVNLGILNKGEVLYIEILESSQPLRLAATVGSRMSIHSTALGKAITAYLPESEVKTLISQKRLVKYTERTITDPKKLRKELELVHRRGYSLDDNENEAGVTCIAAPVFDSTGRPVAAISLSGPANRVLANREEIATAVVAAGRELSRKLGFNETPVKASAGQ